MNNQTSNRGLVIESEKVIFFFGHKLSLIEGLKADFPLLKFNRIRQIHGDKAVRIFAQNLDSEVTADAQWTSEKNIALCIATADCIPCLIYCHITNRIAAIHAGWKGVANQIIPKTLKNLIDTGSPAQSFQVICGPHIKSASFEVDTQVRNEILQTLNPRAREKCVVDKDSGKSFIDLEKVATFQMLDLGLQVMQIESINIDTKTDTSFHSYRRDKENSGRNLSFIVLKP